MQRLAEILHEARRLTEYKISTSSARGVPHIGPDGASDYEEKHVLPATVF